MRFLPVPIVDFAHFAKFREGSPRNAHALLLRSMSICGLPSEPLPITAFLYCNI
jgi:hypothetical protein